MILSFSGTGNSRYAADFIAKEINDEIIDLNKRIKNNDFSEIFSENPFVICVPTYSWRIPVIVEKHLLKTKLSGCKKAYFVMTCGDDNGNAAKYIKKLCEKTALEFAGCEYVVMPENYIAMFSSPSDEEALNIIKKASPKLKSIAKIILNGENFGDKKVNITDILKSSIVNKAFYALCVKADKFRADDKCISCGKCIELCPLNNISLNNGKPEWGKNCTHCMACICRCPSEAIEYGNVSKGQNRYYCKAIK